MWFLGALLAINVVHAQQPAAPAPDEQALERARVLFANGKRLYDEGSYEAAIEAWEACYEISKLPALLYNLSNAHERLGDPREALSYLNRYRAIADLPPEEHDRLARKASTLELRVREAEEQPAPVAPATAPVEPSPLAPRRRSAAGGVALTVTGGAALVTGAVLGGLALQTRSQLREDCRDLGDGFLCTETASSDISRAEGLGTAAVVALGAGGAGLVSGVSLLVAGGGGAPTAGLSVHLRR